MSRMAEYMNSSESSTIFTDDLKSALSLAENDDDVAIAVQMARRCMCSLSIIYALQAECFAVI